MENVKIIVDSCCDLTEEMRASVVVAPLKITVDDTYEYIDDEHVDVSDMLLRIAQSNKPPRSACPSPADYAELMEDAQVCYVITLSSKLSGSYNAAMIGREMAMEKDAQKRIYVFDSESATAGESQLLLYLQKLLSQGLGEQEIVEKMQEKIAGMHTLFVLDDLNNLMKNGRLGKIAGTLASVLSIRPLLSDDGQGEIKMLTMARGMKNALRSLVNHVGQLTQEAPSKSIELVLTFCNCPERAQELKQSLLSACAAIKDVVVIPTGALSSMYAADGGVVIAF